MASVAEHADGAGAGQAEAGVLAPEDLAEVIQAYSAVAERLQASHEALSGEVSRLQKELAAKNEQLERSKRLSALGEMAAGIAHEIRNPLAAIQLYAEMVADDLEPTQVSERSLCFAADNTQKIADAVRGLSAIVNDVLSFARQIEPKVRRLDAAEVFQRVVDAHRPAIEAQGVAVAVEVVDGVIEADPDLLHQALLNLVRNAVDAMAGRGGGRLTLSAGAGRVVLTDTGPGLPQEVVDRIFNPFFTTRSTGTGLGLAIVHRIVDAHGGAIAVHNHERHGGAVFTLDLPRSETSSAGGVGGMASESEVLESAV
ncbi:sensor histidine kinase [Algisphaera agarilytica]|uniref:histidine kinase n=1 Tax=Algisphaera agarilytica TaxID=1385975 RepID=A0A7X0H9P5_9BACT|nr:ATP-binding protein [Algisphaera agarilytica]MBB6430731.1 signal transduction histidine kinase [Algisphaera agarilytica]